MSPEQVWTNYPYLWHMAESGMWSSIRDRGLLSTSSLLDLYEVSGLRRTSIERQRRPECVTITRSGLPDVVIRDQKPMSDGALIKCLEDGYTPAKWYHMLNRRTFFWLSQPRLRRLLGARAYRKRPQTVLTIDTRSLIEAYQKTVELCPINSGSTIYNPVRRGKKTFVSIKNYDYDAWRKKGRSKTDAVVELVVPGGVPDIRNHVIAVHEVIGGTGKEIWRRPGASEDIGF